MGHFSGLRSLERSLRGGGQIGKAQRWGSGGSDECSTRRLPSVSAVYVPLVCVPGCISLSVWLSVQSSVPCRVVVACQCQSKCQSKCSAVRIRYGSVVQACWVFGSFVPATSSPTRDHSPPAVPHAAVQATPKGSFNQGQGKGTVGKDDRFLQLCLLC